MPRALLLGLLVPLVGACATTSRQAAEPRISCSGRTMRVIVNQSAEAVEAVAVQGGTERVLAMAPPGLASHPFNPPRPEEQNYSRPDERRAYYWYLREVATRRLIPSRDAQVRTDLVCVETD